MQKLAGDISMGQLSKIMFANTKNMERMTHYIEVDVRGLRMFNTKPNNFLYRSNMNLNLSGRIKSHGLVLGSE